MLLTFKWTSDKELALESKGCHRVCVCCENMLCRVKIVYTACNTLLKHTTIIYLIYIHRTCVCAMLCKTVYSLLFKKGVHADHLSSVKEYRSATLLYKEHRSVLYRVKTIFYVMLCLEHRSFSCYVRIICQCFEKWVVYFLYKLCYSMDID